MASAQADDHTHTHAEHVTAQTDPTQTKTLREQEFRPTLTKRFRALKGAIRTTVGYDQDALRLRQQSRAATTAAPDDIRPRDQFVFRTDAEAVDNFQSWLETQLNQGVLEVADRSSVRNGEHYTGRYIRSAASKGWEDATTRLVRAGYDPEALQASFNAPVAQDQLEQLYSRTYTNLEGITDDLQRNIRRELTGGLAEGVNPREMARRLTNTIDLPPAADQDWLSETADRKSVV